MLYKRVQEILGLDKPLIQYSMEELINLIREYHQIIIYTVNQHWVIQLLDINMCGNDEGNCEWENDNEDLMSVLRNAIEYIAECSHERNHG